jgi:hypothetical protein
VIFQGFFSPAAETTEVAIFSDDGCDVWVNGVRILDNFGKGQHLPTLKQSFIQLKYDWKKHQTYHIKVRCSNTIFNGSTDIDGCTLFAYSGGGLCDDVHLFIDADNNNGTNPPDGSAAEQREQHNPNAVGKIIFVNHNDDDGDGIPDYADLHVPGEQNFVPLVLKISNVVDWRNVRVTFRYPGVKALDLKSFEGVDIGNGFKDYTGAQQGRFRLWNVRSPSDRRTETNYIQPGKAYKAADLGFTGAQGKQTFFIETVGDGGGEGGRDDFDVEVECTHTVQLNGQPQTLQVTSTDKAPANNQRVGLGVNNSNFSEQPAATRPLRVGVPDVEFRIDEHDEKGKLVRDDHDRKARDQKEGFVFWWARDTTSTVTNANVVDWFPLVVEVPDTVLEAG